MKPVKKQTDAELLFIIEDCAEAIMANPLGQKTEQYLAEARACQLEFRWRDKVRHIRKGIRQLRDPLDVPVQRHYNRMKDTMHQKRSREEWRGAAAAYGFLKCDYRVAV